MDSYIHHLRLFGKPYHPYIARTRTMSTVKLISFLNSHITAKSKRTVSPFSVSLILYTKASLKELLLRLQTIPTFTVSFHSKLFTTLVYDKTHTKHTPNGELSFLSKRKFHLPSRRSFFLFAITTTKRTMTFSLSYLQNSLKL